MAFAVNRSSAANASASDKVDEVANQAAEQFVENYYSALNSARHAIHSYYVPSSTLPDAFSGFFSNDTQHPLSEVDVIDCHILNHQYPAQDGTSRNNTVPHVALVVVNGVFKQGSGREQVEQEFSETLILVPNPDAPPRNQGGRHRKDYLIQSQTFRVVG